MSDDEKFDGFENQFSPLAGSAGQIHEVYQAYVDAGFTPDQAMQIVLVQIHAATTGGER